MKCTGEWTAEQLAGLSLADITSLDLTAIAIPSDATLNANKNPNCLIYINQDATAPNTWKNVVKINGETELQKVKSVLPTTILSSIPNTPYREP